MAKVAPYTAPVLDKAEPLFKRETSQYINNPPITTATFFDGTCLAEAEAHLSARLRLVVDANPWVAGKLKKLKGGVHLVHPVHGADVAVESILSVLPSPVAGLSTTTPFQRVAKLVEALQCPNNGGKQIKSGLPVTRAVLAPSEEGGFVLVFSMSVGVGSQPRMSNVKPQHL